MPEFPISIVIPARNNPGEVTRCIASILKADYKNYEIVLVDDGSLPRLGTALSPDPRITPIYRERPSGAAAARNLGVKTARHDIIYFLDSDIELAPDNLKKMSAHFEDRSIQAVMGISDYRPLNNTFMAHYQALFEYFMFYAPATTFADVFNPRNAAIRKALFLEMRGFDTSFGTSLEEAEFAQRLKKQGIPVAYDTAITVRHAYPATFKEALTNHFKRGFTWLRIYIKRQGKTTSLGGTSPSIVKGIVMHFMFFGSLALSMASPWFLALAAFFYGWHLLYFSPFYALCFRKKGLSFMIEAAMTKLLMSFTMGLSQCLSLVTIPFYKKDVL
ncbi:MAG: glycosyltransferase family 2 protein [Candidatus Omnitrophica bacterium]|nr:glycosyltransferase family 2 protein [Candidatus Omnitrophota bacterium]